MDGGDANAVAGGGVVRPEIGTLEAAATGTGGGGLAGGRGCARGGVGIGPRGQDGDDLRVVGAGEGQREGGTNRRHGSMRDIE